MLVLKKNTFIPNGMRLFRSNHEPAKIFKNPSIYTLSNQCYSCDDIRLKKLLIFYQYMTVKIWIK